MADPLRDPRDPAWQLVGIIMAVTTLIISILSFTGITRLVAALIVSVGLIVGIRILFLSRKVSTTSSQTESPVQQSSPPLQSKPTHIQPSPVTNPSLPPARQSLISKVFSMIGMIIGGILALTGFILAISSLASVGLNLFPAGIVDLYLGLMIFFIARIRKSSLSLSKAIGMETVIGIVVGAAAILFGIGAIIITGTTTNVFISNGSGGQAAGIVAIIAGVIILLTMRIRIKKSPQ